MGRITCSCLSVLQEIISEYGFTNPSVKASVKATQSVAWARVMGGNE